MSINRFGDFFFVSFNKAGTHGGAPDILSQTTEVVQRPGCDGTGVILLGIKGEPFQMRSFVDCETFNDADVLAAEYKACIGTGPFGIIWGGLNYLAIHDVVYVPLHVEIVAIKRCRAAAGGLNPPSLATVEALWSLVPIQAPEEEP